MTRWHGGRLLLFLFATHCAAAHAQSVIDSVFTPRRATHNYGDPRNWTPQAVPNNSPDYSFNVKVPMSVEVDINAVVSNLEANGLSIGKGLSLTVTSAATITSPLTPDPTGMTHSGLSLVNGGVFAVDGSLTNFDANSRTLRGGAYDLSGYPESGGGVSLFRFRGADVVNNAASIGIHGPLAQIVDENGLSGLRNFARNTETGTFQISHSDFTTAGDFTNDGTLGIHQGVFHVSGSLTNYDRATRTLTGGTYQIGGYEKGRLIFPGADIVRNAATLQLFHNGAVTDENGIDATRNLAFNDVGGSFVAWDGFQAAADFANAGTVLMASPFGPGSGEFRVAPGHRYIQTGGETIIASARFTGAMEINGGTLKAGSSFFAGVAAINGSLLIGDALISVGEISVTGSVAFSPGARIRIGRSEGFMNQLPAALVVAGPVSLAGTIEIEDPGDFPAASGYVFPAIQSQSLTGTFSNAPNGTRVPTTNGRGSFIVSYQDNQVFVDGYERIPRAAQLLNISTRAQVGTGDNVSIGGFIIGGREPKQVVVRGIGPSLARSGVTGVLDDPVIELHDAAGNIIARNNDWRESQESDIAASGLAPEEARESAMIATLARGAYTVILRGDGQSTGTALVEVYDVAAESRSRIANISTRGFVDSDHVLIGGVIAGGSGEGPAELTVRAIGAGLKSVGVPNGLPNPALEVRGRNGELIATNDDHSASSENARTIGPELRPSEAKDAATGIVVPRGEYTVIVRAKAHDSGIALVEIYDLNR